MQSCASFRPSIETFSESHRTTSYVFCGGFDSRKHHARLDAQNAVSVDSAFALETQRVEHIARASSPLQVVLAVVLFVAVLVVDLG